jgi:hypothetical protein
MRRILRPAALSMTCMMAAWSVAADAPSGQVLYTGNRQQALPLSNVGDPTTVAKARLFVTVDNGKTWTIAHELVMPAGTKDLPKFPFSVDHDGAFGIMPCITYRSGQSEPEPKPGQAPPYVLVVDSLAPVIARFDVTLMGRAAAKAVVRLSWSVTDANPEKEPIAIEASSDGGTRFITIHRGELDGAVELTVPVAADARDLQLRLVATDRARNVTVSPSRNINLAPVEPVKAPAPIDPKEMLAKAAATLPTLAEVGAGDAKPLPTTSIARPSQDNPNAATAPKPSNAVADTTVPPTPTPQAEHPVSQNVPTDRADVLVNGKPYVAPAAVPAPAAPAANAPEMITADNSVDQAYYDALAATRDSGPINSKTAVRKPTAPYSAEPTENLVRAEGDGHRAPASKTVIVVDDAVKTLRDARLLAATGHLNDACDLYERLHFSSLSKTALTEEVQLLISIDRPRDALTAIASAPVEIVSDPVRIEHGRLLMQFERPGEVEAAVAGVSGNGPEARPALMLIAKAYRALGKTAESQRAFAWLARGTDAIATEARALVGR